MGSGWSLLLVGGSGYGQCLVAVGVDMGSNYRQWLVDGGCHYRSVG